MPTPSRISTPFPVRWQRVQYQLVPLLTVILCSLVAWRVWQETPHANAVGQVNVVSEDARSPGAGVLGELPEGRQPQVFGSVSSGQIIARLDQGNGKVSDITAPFSGRIVAIHRGPGESVKAGDPIVTVTSDRGQYITTYLRANQNIQPELGMAVDLRLRSDPSKTFHTWVERIGPQFEPIPPAQLRERKTEEWGLPVILAIPPEAKPRPGELVDLGWHLTHVTDIRAEDHPTTTKDDEVE